MALMTNIKSRNLDVHRFVWCVTNWVSRPVPSISSRISYSNLRHPFLLVCVIFNFLIYFVYLCTHHLCVCRLVGVGGFSYHMHPRDQTKVIRLGDRSLSALSHLANSLIFLFFFFLRYIHFILNVTILPEWVYVYHVVYLRPQRSEKDIDPYNWS